MPPSPTAMERFINLLGGEQNLPPKREPTPPSSPAPAAEDDLPTAEQYFAGNPPEKSPSDLQPKQKQPQSPRFPPRQPLASPQAPPPPPPPQLTENQLKYDERCGEPAPEGMKFTPFQAITKFPYKYVPNEWRQPLASAFFDQSKIWDRKWDMYYIFNGYFPTTKPTTFVPEEQLTALISEINDQFPDANIKLDDKTRKELVYDFTIAGPMSSDFRPRFLGHTTQREQIDHWVHNLQFPGHVTISTSIQNDEAYKSFVNQMEDAIEAGKNKKKNNKKSPKTSRIDNLLPHSGRSTSALITSAQRYLGLKPEDESLSAAMTKLNLNVPNSWTHKLEPIFIAIDCEAYEEGAHAVTEVGVATLDTRDLKHMPPGPWGENWRQYIRARHFRIKERTHMVNKKWVDGCPGKFEFGESEFVSKDDIASVLTSCFHPPFSAGPRPTNPEDDDDEEEEEAQQAAGPEVGPRNIILLGHDLKQDIEYCHDIGFSVLNRDNLTDTMDTARMYQLYKRDANPTSLPKVLYDFEISAWHAHNGGNDAVYTIWALLAICARAAEEEEDGGGGVRVSEVEEEVKPVFGPERPPEPSASGFYTMGGVPLDV